MTQLCKKLAISTIAALALAGASLTASTQIVKANDYQQYNTEFLEIEEKAGYQELLDFLKSQGIDDHDSDFYLDFNSDKDYVKMLKDFKTKTKEQINTQVATELDAFFEKYAPVPSSS
ncbi:hypothetical protein ACVRWQ_01725 [Streptococcus phocae subsp. salmonis]|uniref:hypothetical protein n=1 Tax=Streptococcus phocae TaxID=119224 RepID=UPI000531890B|nr:hypothetical protein [Streptococcus phocae]KGR72817.1 hypothetical protein NX86_03510 [Streptococcus phocae subsp. salmonis]